MDCRDARRRIEACFAEADEEALRELRPHLRSCERCRQHYDRVCAADAALSGPDAVLGAGELALLEAVALGRGKRRRRRALAVLVPISALAAAGLAALVLRQPLPGPEPEHFTARGAPTSGAAGPLGFRPFCVRQTEHGTDVLPARTDPVAPPRCRLGDQLGFAGRNETGQPWYIHLVALPAAAPPLLLAMNHQLAANSAMAPLPFATRLEKVGPGRATLLAGFSRRLLEESALLSALRVADPRELAGRLRRAGIEVLGELQIGVEE